MLLGALTLKIAKRINNNGQKKPRDKNRGRIHAKD
jgi:hypothetical protein